LLLASEKDRQPEAIELWRANLRQAPEDIPSLLSLAETLAAQGDNAGAIEQYRIVVRLKPGYIAARVALAGLLAKTGDPDGALNEFREASKVDPQNPDLLEQIGDLQLARGRGGEAKTAYQSARDLASDRGSRKRLDNKLKSIR
jgi:Flp pilus assembly protein TadD